MNTRLTFTTLLTLVPSLAAWQEAAKVPAVRPFVDANHKTEVRLEPPKSPGHDDQPAAPVRATGARAAADAGATSRKATPRLPKGEVRVSQAHPGETWARGDSYKAGFSARGAAFVPFLGASAPQDFPLELRLRRAAVAGCELPVKADAVVTTDAQRVVLDRGPVVEAWDLRPDAVEQTLMFSTLPARGELRVDFDLTTTLTGAPHGDGLRFANDLGAVDYGAATAIDARGHRVAVTERLADGVLTLTVPAAFVADAALPLTIDPLINVVVFGTPNTVERNTDVAFDTRAGCFMVTWEEVFSAADSDVHTQLLDLAQAVVPGSTQDVDLTTVTWQRPRLANLYLPRRCLVAAEVGVAPSRAIWGRAVDVAPFANMTAQTRISGSGLTGDQFHVDVGGDPNAIGPTFWLVVWERALSASDHDILGQLVDANGLPSGPVILIDNSLNSVDSHPAVSKCDGVGPFVTQQWVVVYQHTYNPTDEDIWHATVRWDGSINQTSTVLNNSSRNDTNPTVSSITDDHGGPRRWLAVYEGHNGAQTQLFGSLAQAPGSFLHVNLSALENSTAVRSSPRVDSDGNRFTVAYCEPTALGDNDVWVSTYHVVYGSEIRVSDGHVRVASGSANDRSPSLCSLLSGGRNGSPHYIITWDSGTLASDTLGAAGYEGYGPGTWFTTLPTGCDGLDMQVQGLPILSWSLLFQMTNVGANVGVVMLGAPFGPATVCPPCGLGVDPTTAWFFAGTGLALGLPWDGAFFNTALAVQGLTLGVGPCLNQVRTSSTVRFTIR